MLRRYIAGGVCNSTRRLDGKTVLITGANSGIGKETAIDLARRGARIIMACRDVQRSDVDYREVMEESGSTSVVLKKLDLGSLVSIRQFASEVISTEPLLHVLINNAGVMACSQMKTKDNFEMQFGVNHLGHFLLTNLLMDLLKKSAPSRVVTVSSRAHFRCSSINFDDINMERNYNRFSAYSQSKLANILFTRELHARFSGFGVTTYSLHPGVVKTNLGRHLSFPVSFMFDHSTYFMKTSQEGAQTSIYCAVQEGIEPLSGEYFSDCQHTEMNRLGRDDMIAQRLWALSESMVGL